jgi:hypothetical protein
MSRCAVGLLQLIDGFVPPFFERILLGVGLRFLPPFAILGEDFLLTIFLGFDRRLDLSDPLWLDLCRRTYGSFRWIGKD